MKLQQRGSTTDDNNTQDQIKIAVQQKQKQDCSNPIKQKTAVEGMSTGIQRGPRPRAQKFCFLINDVFFCQFFDPLKHGKNVI